ncbi:HAD-like domain-containing protein [Powellomyces hirtus]|nr:HAD-like domain-containing protein [Powellomyces hirtus]
MDNDKFFGHKTGLIFNQPRVPLPPPASSNMLPPHPPASTKLTTLVTDFDCTLTSSDTLSIIATLSTQHSPPPLPWSHFVDAYMKDYTAHLARVSQKPKDGEEDNLHSYLSSFAQLEQDSVTRVSSSGVLKGVSRAALETAGANIPLRGGADRVLSRWTGRVVVASVNWSTDLVSAAVRKQVGPDSLCVVANDLEFDENGAATGVVRADMLVGEHKLDKVEDEGVEWSECVCIGDSQTDLPLLLAARIGILLDPSVDVFSLCARFNITIRDIANASKDSETTAREPVLFSATSWTDVEQMLERFGALA